jgi:hypothetical protein
MLCTLGKVWTRVLLMDTSQAPQIRVHHLGTLVTGVEGTIEARISWLLCCFVESGTCRRLGAG